jgi:hypothetical protein
MTWRVIGPNLFIQATYLKFIVHGIIKSVGVGRDREKGGRGR